MSEAMKFNAEFKDNNGKGSSRALRKDGKLPIIIYGGEEKPQMLALSLKEFFKEYSKGGIKTRLAEINAGEQTFSAIVKDIQIHPVSDRPIHADFLRVGENTLVTVSITIRTINENESPGVKKGGIANIVNRQVEFRCHPANIPHHIEIDLANLEIGHIVHINDIKLPEGVYPVDTSNFTLVTIIGRIADEEKVTSTTDTATPAAATT